MVNSIVQNNLTPQQRAFALKLAIVHPDVRALAKSAGLIDNPDFIEKNYILNNKQPRERVGQMMTEAHLCSQLLYHQYHQYHKD